MVSTLRVKSGGVWRGPVADGTVLVKKNGAWTSPTTIKVKSGGVWKDTGYSGVPNAPSTPWVHAWNYGVLQWAWTAASGGAPISHYEVQLLDVNGNYISGNTENSTDNLSPGWVVSQDTRYQCRVRSVGTNGLVSAWQQSPVNARAGIGHPVSYTYGYVERYQAWSTGGSIGHGSAHNLHGFAVPNRVLVNRINWQLYLYGRQPEMFGPISVWPTAYVDGGNRYLDIVLNYNSATDYYLWYRPNWPNSINGNDYPSYWGNGGITGFIPRETQAYAWGYLEVHGAMYIYGNQYYDNYEITSTNPEQGNYYW